MGEYVFLMIDVSRLDDVSFFNCIGIYIDVILLLEVEYGIVLWFVMFWF